MFLAGTLFTSLNLDQHPHKMEELIGQYSMFFVFLLAVVVAPIIEEVIFRSYLRWPFSIVIIYIISLITVLILLFTKFDFLLASTLVLFALVGHSIFRNIDKIEDYFKDKFGFVFYFSVIIFAYIHIFNFGNVTTWYYVPILVLPQFILALYLGYVRVRNNLLASIYIHMLNNIIPMLMWFATKDIIDGI